VSLIGDRTLALPLSMPNHSVAVPRNCTPRNSPRRSTAAAWPYCARALHGSLLAELEAHADQHDALAQARKRPFGELVRLVPVAEGLAQGAPLRSVLPRDSVISLVVSLILSTA
jgi:hypothetical protein